MNIYVFICKGMLLTIFLSGIVLGFFYSKRETKVYNVTIKIINLIIPIFIVLYCIKGIYIDKYIPVSEQGFQNASLMVILGFTFANTLVKYLK